MNAFRLQCGYNINISPLRIMLSVMIWEVLTLIFISYSFLEFFQSASSLSTSKKLIFGLFIVIAIATSWVGSTQTAKSTYDGKFKAPFFLVWFSTSWMMLVYPITVPLYFILNWKLPTWNNLRALWR